MSRYPYRKHKKPSNDPDVAPELPQVPLPTLTVTDLCDPILGRRLLVETLAGMCQHAAAHGWFRLLATVTPQLMAICEKAWAHEGTADHDEVVVGELISELADMAEDEPEKIAPYVDQLEALRGLLVEVQHPPANRTKNPAREAPIMATDKTSSARSRRSSSR